VNGTTSRRRYVVISPVRDEERYIDLTMQSVIRQTSPPALWAIVDDGSTDRTPDIVRAYAARYPFIRLVDHKRAGERHPGSRVIHAFNRGLELLGPVECDFIVKLDCDLSFAPDYFERLLARFDAHPRLGIASGVYLEKAADGRWRLVKMPPYHAFGACKVVRRQCFEEIQGFLTMPGWDTVDEIRAWSAGWETGHFTDLETKHHKPEGTGIGRLRTSRMHGEIFYATGGDPLFLLFKVLRRVTTSPLLVGALAVSWGYLHALVLGKPRLVTPAQARAYRRVLRRRMAGRGAMSALPVVRLSE
jgi:poly-beta-1,6-N-acetyl-D-glucosamine synthase